MIPPVCLVTLLRNLPLPEPSHSRAANARVLVKAFSDATDRYKADVGDYPSESAGLQALMNDFGARNWRGPYLPLNRPFLYRFLDPWGHHYVYRLNGTRKPEVISYGADGRPGERDLTLTCRVWIRRSPQTSGYWRRFFVSHCAQSRL